MEKWKRNKTYIIITSLVVLIPMFVGLILWKRLPDELVTHWGYDGTPDGWDSKEVAVFGLPVFCLLTHIICTAATMADPKQKRIGDKIFKLVLLICPVVSLICGASIYGTALSLDINVAWIAQIFLGLGLIAIGNYMPKCRQNYTVGIKLPWTLADEENWNHTHRMAGWLWILGGVLVIMNAFLDYLGNMCAMIALLLIMVFVPIGYSFVYYIKNQG